MLSCLMPMPQLTYYQLSDHVTAFSTTRKGGVSQGLYGEFNINEYCGDDISAVSANRVSLAQLLGIEETRIIAPHQVHGVEVRQVASDFLSMPLATRRMLIEGVDALTTDVEGVCIGVSTADCIPVVLYDAVHHAAAVVHAGWRGTVGCIVQHAVRAMRRSYGTEPRALCAQIGPGISLDAFEVGDEVYETFAGAGFEMQHIAQRRGKWHIDLPKCNQMQLQACGVELANIRMLNCCTFNHPEKYFSARRLGIDSGRVFTGIVLKNKMAL